MTENSKHKLTQVQYSLRGLSGLLRQAGETPPDTQIPLTTDEQYGVSVMLTMLADMQEVAYEDIEQQEIDKSA